MRTLIPFFALVASPLVAVSSEASMLEIPCFECPEFQRPAIPESGFWYNPDQPGTGYSIEVQGRTLAGSYHGYTPEGQPEWFTFSGLLERAEAGAGYAWHMQSPLFRSAGGACLSCPYTPPETTQPVALVRFEFQQRSQARVSVDAGEWELIQPLVFGVATTPEFTPVVEFPVPDLDGPWVLVFQDDNGNSDDFSRYAFIVNIKGFAENPIVDQRFDYVVVREVVPPEGELIGDLGCVALADGTPTCRFKSYVGRGVGRNKDFFLPLGNLSDSRFKAEAADGETVEGFRIDHD